MTVVESLIVLVLVGIDFAAVGADVLAAVPVAAFVPAEAVAAGLADTGIAEVERVIADAAQADRHSLTHGLAPGVAPPWQNAEKSAGGSGNELVERR